MIVQLKTGLKVDVDYNYTPFKKSNSWYDPDQQEEFYIENVDLIEGSLLDLLVEGMTLEQIEMTALKQLKDEMAEAHAPD